MLRFPSERFGSNSFCLAMHEFSDFISNFVLVDVPLLEARFM